MTKKAHGQIRQSQVITTWGPGALLDLPSDSVIVGGLDGWPATHLLREIHEPRIVYKLQGLTGVAAPKLYAPPPDTTDPSETKQGIRVWLFPEWFLVQESSAIGNQARPHRDATGSQAPRGGSSTENQRRDRSRRLVHRRALDERGRFDGCKVVATRFVRGCPRGHIDDLDWRWFVHGPDKKCTRQLWLDERGTSGDLADLVVRCECQEKKGMHEATDLERNPLGTCRGARPWLGRGYNEDCSLPSRLLIRTASNAYFPQVLSALSLPDRGSEIKTVVTELWSDLGIVTDLSSLGVIKRKPSVAARLAPFEDEAILQAIDDMKRGTPDDRPVKQVEIEALLAVPEGYGDDVPIDFDFHARRLPETAWKKSVRSRDIECVIQLHRLRDVLALIGFTRFEAVSPDINGEYETDVERAALSREPSWFPAVENRGEGIFLQLGASSLVDWQKLPAVQERLRELLQGHVQWAQSHKSGRIFPGGPYVLLHTLSHLLIQSLSMRCGYPASSIRERIYADTANLRYGILLYTSSPDAEGTLGGLVQEARHIEAHLAAALRVGALCSNDPICAQHAPGGVHDQRWLHGAACHGCAFIAETSCEMHNDYLDRALVVPSMGVADAAFFGNVV